MGWYEILVLVLAIFAGIFGLLKWFIQEQFKNTLSKEIILFQIKHGSIFSERAKIIMECYRKIARTFSIGYPLMISRPFPDRETM